MRPGTALISRVIVAATCLALLSACSPGQADVEAPEQEPAAETIIVLDETAADSETAAEQEPEPTPEPEPEPEPEPALDLDAPVVTETGASGIVATAPQGLVGTSAFARLEEEAAAITSAGHELSFVLLDLQTGRSLSYSPDSRMYPASCMKAAFSTYVCETNGGAGGLSGTMEQCLVNSSNDAYHDLIDTFGLVPFEKWLDAHGGPAYDPSKDHRYYPNSTANELAAVWQEIYRYGTSGEAGSGELTSYLARTNNSPLGEVLRGSYEVWSKPGWYPADGNGLEATNDMGVVFSDCGPYVVVIMTNMSSNLDGLLPLVDALNAVHGTMCGGATESLL